MKASNMSVTWVLSKVFLKIFSRDRQAIIFSLFFPVLMMLVFGFFNNGEAEPLNIGITDYADSPLSRNLIDSTRANPTFNIIEDSEATLRAQVSAGELALALLIPESFAENAGSTQLTLLVDASQTAQMNTIMPIIEQALSDIERELLGIEPLFTLRIEDIEARALSYLDFLVPGLLALTLMQISMGGSGFNLVEFRRKGILKRLFVTPVKSQNFITGLVLSRLLICLVQLSILLGFAILLLDIHFIGNLLSLYVFIVLGTGIFLSIGFSLGSLAKTQQAIMALNMLVTWPQILMSGIFYPIDVMPTLVQPLASVLPLSFIVNGLRGIAVDGTSLAGLLPDLAGALIWLMLSLLLAVRLFNWKEVAS